MQSAETDNAEAIMAFALSVFFACLEKSFLTVKWALTFRLYDKNQQRKGGENP